MTDCIFCKIAAGEIKPDVLFEDERVLAFRDIQPQAPAHLLVIPKTHIATLNDLQDEALAGHLLKTAATVAGQLGYADSGYRAVVNTNDDGGQTVHHLHMHVLAGRHMHWPPG